MKKLCVDGYHSLWKRLGKQSSIWFDSKDIESFCITLSVSWSLSSSTSSSSSASSTPSHHHHHRLPIPTGLQGGGKSGKGVIDSFLSIVNIIIITYPHEEAKKVERESLINIFKSIVNINIIITIPTGLRGGEKSGNWELYWQLFKFCDQHHHCTDCQSSRGGKVGKGESRKLPQFPLGGRQGRKDSSSAQCLTSHCFVIYFIKNFK